MIRQIKFRGLRTDTKEFVYGGIRSYIPTTDSKKILYWIIPESTNESIEVVPESVGQFTGKTDQNGTEIYEKDRVNTRYGEDTVSWDEGCCGFYPFCRGSNAPNPETETEVIENTTQNPEMLEEEK